jgi:hypothetical protein
MVPADSADRVGSELSVDWKVEDRVKCPCVLPGARAGCLEKLLGLRVDGQILPHELGVYAETFSEVISPARHEIPPVIDKRAQVSLREAKATSDIKKPFAVIILCLRWGGRTKNDCYRSNAFRPPWIFV